MAGWGSRLARNLQDLEHLARPAPALYCCCAAYHCLAAAAAAILPGSRRRSATDSVVQPECGLSSKLAAVPPAPASDLVASCCLPRAAAFAGRIAGNLGAATAMSSATLSRLLQLQAPVQRHMSRLHQHTSSSSPLHQHRHHHHHYHAHGGSLASSAGGDDVRSMLLLGCSLFALYKEPSQQAWMALLANLHDEDLPHAQRPHDLLLPRSSSSRFTQPRWVARRMSIQQV